MDLKSLTPLAEFVDIIYTRCATELSPIEGLKWRVELRPPVTKDDGVGMIIVHGHIFERKLIIEQRFVMDTITQGHGAPLEEMTIVADYHIAEFKSKVIGHE